MVYPKRKELAPLGSKFFPFRVDPVSERILCVVVYSTDRSNAVVPVLVLLFVALWFILRRRFVLCLTLCHFVLVVFSHFNIAITSLGEERASLSAFRTFV